MQLKENLKDAYFCTPKCKDQRKSVKFQYKGQMIQYKNTAILAGIRFKTFTKIMTPTIALLRHIGVWLLIYLDDTFILLLNQSQEGLLKDINKQSQEGVLEDIQNFYCCLII